MKFRQYIRLEAVKLNKLFNKFVCLINCDSLLYVHGMQLRSCQDGQLF